MRWDKTCLLTATFIVDLLLLIGGIVGSIWLGPRMLALATASIGLVTFYGFFIVGYGPEFAIERAMRNAIASSVVAMYLTTVGIVTFVRLESGAASPEIDPLTKTM